MIKRIIWRRVLLDRLHYCFIILVLALLACAAFLQGSATHFVTFICDGVLLLGNDFFGLDLVEHADTNLRVNHALLRRLAAGSNVLLLAASGGLIGA